MSRGRTVITSSSSSSPTVIVVNVVFLAKVVRFGLTVTHVDQLGRLRVRNRGLWGPWPIVIVKMMVKEEAGRDQSVHRLVKAWLEVEGLMMEVGSNEGAVFTTHDQWQGDICRWMEGRRRLGGAVLLREGGVVVVGV